MAKNVGNQGIEETYEVKHANNYGSTENKKKLLGVSFKGNQIMPDPKNSNNYAIAHLINPYHESSVARASGPNLNMPKLDHNKALLKENISSLEFPQVSYPKVWEKLSH